MFRSVGFKQLHSVQKQHLIYCDIMSEVYALIRSEGWLWRVRIYVITFIVLLCVYSWKSSLM